MKKILLSVVCLVMVGMQSVNAQLVIAALHHEGNVTTYPSTNLKGALDAAVKGDTLYLSEGIFDGFTVEKPIAIIGAGQSTVIAGDINVSSENSVEEGLLLSGLNVTNIHFRGVVMGARVLQCKIPGFCEFSGTDDASYNNIEIISSEIDRFIPSDKINYMSVVASKIRTLNNGVAENGNIVFLNCNIRYCHGDNINFQSCIVSSPNSGVFHNCLCYGSSSLMYDCYELIVEVLDDDLNSIMSDDELKAAGYLGPDNTWVGINGGQVKFSLVMPIVQVVEHNIEVDQAEKKLKVTLKLGNK